MNGQSDRTAKDARDALQAARAEGMPAALATIIEMSGASPARPGFKMLLLSIGEAFPWPSH